MKITLENTFGALLLGTMAATMLFGITLVQVYTYYRNFPNDRKFLKFAVSLVALVVYATFMLTSGFKVAFLLLLDILHVVTTIVAIYHYLINAFGNVYALQYLSWSFKLQVTLNVGIVVGVQSLYAWRVYLLGKNFSLIWPCIVILLVTVGGIYGIIVAIKTYSINNFDAIHKIHSVLNASFISATVIDLANATAICYYIQSNRTACHGATKHRVVRVMKYVLICGFLTSACSLSALIAYRTMSTNFVFIAIDFLLPHLYLNSYLGMLNARNIIKNSETSFDASNVHSRPIRQSVYTKTDNKDYQPNTYGAHEVQSIPIGIITHGAYEQGSGAQRSSCEQGAV